MLQTVFELMVTQNEGPQNYASDRSVTTFVHQHILTFVNKPIWRTVLPYMFISILYMFRANMCPSSGELIVSMRHLIYVTLCMKVGMVFIPNLHTRR